MIYSSFVHYSFLACTIHYSTLKAHTRIHTGKKPPFICTVCSKSFARPDNLKVHSRIHTGEKPFICTLCPKSFARPDVLKAHSRSHTVVLSASDPLPNLTP